MLGLVAAPVIVIVEGLPIDTGNEEVPAPAPAFSNRHNQVLEIPGAWYRNQRDRPIWKHPPGEFDADFHSPPLSWLGVRKRKPSHRISTVRAFLFRLTISMSARRR